MKSSSPTTMAAPSALKRENIIPETGESPQEFVERMVETVAEGLHVLAAGSEEYFAEQLDADFLQQQIGGSTFVVPEIMSRAPKPKLGTEDRDERTAREGFSTAAEAFLGAVTPLYARGDEFFQAGDHARGHRLEQLKAAVRSHFGLPRLEHRDMKLENLLLSKDRRSLLIGDWSESGWIFLDEASEGAFTPNDWAYFKQKCYEVFDGWPGAVDLGALFRGYETVLPP